MCIEQLVEYNIDINSNNSSSQLGLGPSREDLSVVDSGSQLPDLRSVSVSRHRAAYVTPSKSTKTITDVSLHA